MAVTELGQRHQAETAVGPSGAAAEFRFLVRTPPEAQGMPPKAESPTGGAPQTPALVIQRSLFVLAKALEAYNAW